MSFKDYLKELSIDLGDIGTMEPITILKDYKGQKVDLDTIANIIVRDNDFSNLMRKEGLVLLIDYVDKTQKFFDFIIRHLDELKSKYNFKVEPKELEAEYKGVK